MKTDRNMSELWKIVRKKVCEY